MATAQEQLTEIRKAYILSKMAGQTESAKESAVKNLHRMSFDDHAEFTDWADELYGPAQKTEMSEADLDEMMDLITPGFTRKATARTDQAKTAADIELDEIMKNIG